MEGSQDKNLETEADVEAMEEHSLLAGPHCLPAPGGPAHSKLAPPTSFTSEEGAPQPTLVAAFLQLRCPFLKGL